MIKILVIHGPNLNLLGEREPEVYGEKSLSFINEIMLKKAMELGCEIQIRQSNSEGEIVELIQNARKWANGIIINPAAYTHTSVAIRDAISAVRIPTVEVHLTNVYRREKFRHVSFISPVCIGKICGFGGFGYILALEGLLNFLKEEGNEHREAQRRD